MPPRTVQSEALRFVGIVMTSPGNGVEAPEGPRQQGRMSQGGDGASKSLWESSILSDPARIGDTLPGQSCVTRTRDVRT